MTNAADTSWIKPYLLADAALTRIQRRQFRGKTYLKATQILEDGVGEQFLFGFEHGAGTLLASDNAVRFPSARHGLAVRYDGTMSDAEHAKVAAEATAEVDVFKTGAGPGHGSVACLWAARRVIFAAVQQWITQQDGTAAFYEELKAGGIQDVAEDELPPGAIIIAPTSGKKIGHIGLLGEGRGSDRLVYSNHSPNARDPVARWEQNYTVGSFVKAHDKVGLKTLFYRLPKPIKS